MLPQHAFNLGRVGYVCNVLSPLLVLWIGTLICFPPELPVTSRNFNYTPVVLLALFLAILSVWFTAGKRFEGPQIDWEVLNNIKIT